MFNHEARKWLRKSIPLFEAAGEVVPASRARAQMAWTLIDEMETQGHTRHADEAYRWAKLAAEAGNGRGQNLLGVCYQRGYGVVRSWEQAADCYRESAEQGHPDGACSYGALLFDGKGVPKNQPLGLEWLRSAAENGSTRASEILSEIRQMEAEERWRANGYQIPKIDMAAMTPGAPPSPLAASAGAGDFPKVSGLLQAGADVEVVDGNGMTALHLAAREGHEAIVSLLLREGAKVNALYQGGGTALHLASRNGHVKVVEVLLSSGADPSLADANGSTALDFALGEKKTRWQTCSAYIPHRGIPQQNQKVLAFEQAQTFESTNRLPPSVKARDFISPTARNGAAFPAS